MSTVSLKIQGQIRAGATSIIQKHTGANMGQTFTVKVDVALLDAINKDFDALFRDIETKSQTKIGYVYRARLTGPKDIAITPVVLN
jgi:hypothetical protein